MVCTSPLGYSNVVVCVAVTRSGPAVRFGRRPQGRQSKASSVSYYSVFSA